MLSDIVAWCVQIVIGCDATIALRLEIENSPKRQEFGQATLRDQLRMKADMMALPLAVDLSTSTFYAWKAKFGGMEVSDAKRLKALEEENAKLKRLYADAMLDNAGLKELLAKKW